MEDQVQIGQVLASKYRVERVIGRGGMGLVLAARHVDLGQLVAIKFMRSAALAFEDSVQRFLREAQVVAHLRSENITRIMDVGRLEDGSLFMVMEYLEGADLATIVARRGPLAVEDAVDYMLQVCIGLAEAHDLGIVHRDLKPANLFLTLRPTGTPLVKVLDFGISKYRPRGGSDALQTNSYGTMGSPAFMSPEQTRSAKYTDHRGDIWSLGVVLYYLLSGKRPFVAGSTPELFVKILGEAPPPLAELAPWVPRGLEAVILGCLEKDPDQRMASAGELAEALAPYASVAGRALISVAHRLDTASLEQVPPEALEPVGEGSVEVAGPEPFDLTEFLHTSGQSPPRVIGEATDQDESDAATTEKARASSLGFAATGDGLVAPDEPDGSEGGTLASVPVDDGTVVIAPSAPARARRRRRAPLIGLIAVVLLAGVWFAFASRLFERARASGDAAPERAATQAPKPATPGADDAVVAGPETTSAALGAGAEDGPVVVEAIEPKDRAGNADSAANDDAATAESASEVVEARESRREAEKRVRKPKGRKSPRTRAQDSSTPGTKRSDPSRSDPFGRID